jgi:WD40 repeat protein
MNTNVDHNIKILKGHSDYVWSMVVLPDGNLVTASNDKTILIWDIEIGHYVNILTGHKLGVRKLMVLPNGNLISISYQGDFITWQ